MDSVRIGKDVSSRLASDPSVSSNCFSDIISKTANSLGLSLIENDVWNGTFKYNSNANVAVIHHPNSITCNAGLYVKETFEKDPDLKTIRNIHLLKLEKL